MVSKRNIHHFAVAGPLGFVAIDTFRPLQEIPLGNQHVAMTYRYLNPTGGSPTAEINWTRVATVFLHN